MTGESDKLLALTEERVLHRYRQAIERRARLLIEFVPAHVEAEDLVQAGSLLTAEVGELWRFTERAIARLPRAERLVLLLAYLRGATNGRGRPNTPPHGVPSITAPSQRAWAPPLADAAIRAITPRGEYRDPPRHVMLTGLLGYDAVTVTPTPEGYADRAPRGTYTSPSFRPLCAANA